MSVVDSVKKAREGNADITVDEEQIKKYDEIIEYLLAAGYFRARISTLSQFDKIIGGLAWCITASNVDVDIELFFDEDLQIGKKMCVSFLSLFLSPLPPFFGLTALLFPFFLVNWEKA